MVGRPFFGNVLCIRRRYRGFFPVSWLSMIAATEGVRIALTVGWLVYFRICAKALEVAVAI